MLNLFLSFTVFFALVAPFKLALAHPVIYKDGMVLSSSNSSMMSDNQVMYSWSNKWSSGLNYWNFDKDDKNTSIYLTKLNHLAYRYNGEDSQANIYLHAGAGLIDPARDEDPRKSVYMTGIDLDWETRKFYSSAKYYGFWSNDLFSLSTTQVRLGYAPYVAAFEELQAWFMLQASHTPDLGRTVMITPLLRFFYHNVLWEIGSSTRGDWMINIMTHI